MNPQLHFKRPAIYRSRINRVHSEEGLGLVDRPLDCGDLVSQAFDIRRMCVVPGKHRLKFTSDLREFSK